MNKWTMRCPLALGLRDVLLDIRKDQQDYILLVLNHYNNAQRLFVDEGCIYNWVAKKSKFTGDEAHFYLDPGLYAEARSRLKHCKELVNMLNQGKVVSSEDVSYFKDNHVHILAPLQCIFLLPGMTIDKAYQDFVLMH